MKNLLAIWGSVNPPPGVSSYGGGIDNLRTFISVLVNTLIIIAGVYAFFNFIFAGYSFLSAGGNPEKVANAWSKIWLSMVGLLIAAGSFVIAGLLGLILFKDFNALLQLKIFTPP